MSGPGSRASLVMIKFIRTGPDSWGCEPGPALLSSLPERGPHQAALPSRARSASPWAYATASRRTGEIVCKRPPLPLVGAVASDQRSDTTAPGTSITPPLGSLPGLAQRRVFSQVCLVWLPEWLPVPTAATLGLGKTCFCAGDLHMRSVRRTIPLWPGPGNVVSGCTSGTTGRTLRRTRPTRSAYVVTPTARGLAPRQALVPPASARLPFTEALSSRIVDHLFRRRAKPVRSTS